MEKCWSICFRILFYITGLLPHAVAQCDGNSWRENGMRSGEIKSPNFETSEYGYSANCTWEFEPESSILDFALVLSVAQLRLFVTDAGQKRCLGSYNLSLNNERIPCEEYVKDEDEGFCYSYYNSSACKSLADVQNCNKTFQTSFPISVEYKSEGIMCCNDTTFTNMHFKLAYRMVQCPEVTTTLPSSKTSTRGKTTTLEMSMSSVSQQNIAEATTSSAMTTYDESHIMIIIATSVGGGIAVLITIIVVVLCAYKRRGKGNRDGLSSTFDDKSTKPELYDQSNATQDEYLQGDDQLKNTTKRACVSGVNGTHQAENQSEKETHDKLDESSDKFQPGIYSTIGRSRSADISENEMYSALHNPLSAQRPTELVPTDRPALYSTVSVVNLGEKNTVHYDKTVVDNVLYGTTEDIY